MSLRERLIKGNNAADHTITYALLDRLAAGTKDTERKVFALRLIKTKAWIDSMQQWPSVTKGKYQLLYHPEKINPQIVKTLIEISSALLHDVMVVASLQQAILLLGHHSTIDVVVGQIGKTDNIAALLARNEKIITQTRVRRSPFVLQDQQAETPVKCIQRWVGFPMINANYNEQQIGLLLCTGEQIESSNRIINRLVTLIHQAETALTYACLYHQLISSNEEIEDELESSTSDLQVAHIELENLDRTKSQFISRASHELRTPLTTIRGYSDILLADQQVRQHAHILKHITSIHTATTNLNEVVDELIDLAKIECNAIKLHQQPLSIAALMQQVCQFFDDALTERNITVSYHNNIAYLPEIFADFDMLQKTFSHLISNAIKYTPDGGIIQIDGHVNRPHKAVEIVISDSGIGIDEIEQQLIFEKFYQLGSTELHSTGKTKFKGSGLGLGLTIAQGFITAHGGQIWVESNGYDEQHLSGSQMYIRLPLPKQDTLASGSLKTAPRQRMPMV